jgi:uncharacterized protein involved in exopolysaccharide biosynthesis
MTPDQTKSGRTHETQIVFGPTADGSASAEPLRARSGEQFISHLRLLWYHRATLLQATIAGLLVSTLIAVLIPKQFEAVTRLMPPDDKSSASGLNLLAAMSGQAGGLGSLASNVLGSKTTGALFVGVLRSRTVEDRLVDLFDMKKVYGVHLEENARARLEEATAISEDHKSGIITVTVTDRNPQLATLLAAANVQELDQLVAELSTSSAHRERVFLEERLKGVKEDLDAAAERFGQFASKNVAIDIQAQGRAMVDAAAELQGQMVAAKAQREGLRQIYSDNNIRVRELDARIGELSRQLEKLGGTNSPQAVEPSTAGSAIYPTIRELPILGVTFADLYRRTKIEEAIYETLTQQYELAKVQEAKETPSVKVLDPAIIPEKKSYPPRGMFVLLGTCLAAVCGLAWISGRTYWDEMNSGDARKAFAREIFAAMVSQSPWAVTNELATEPDPPKTWMPFRRRSVQDRSSK